MTYREFNMHHTAYAQNQRSYHHCRYVYTHLLDVFGSKELSEITTALVDAWRLERLKHVAPASVDREFNCLSGLFSKAVAWGMLETSPCARLKRFNKFSPRYRILHQEETQCVFDAAADISPVVYFCVRFLHDSGCRPSELQALTWSGFNLQTARIKFTRTKTGRPRIITATPGIIAAAAKLPHEYDYVIPRWPRLALANVVTAIDDFRLYDFRKNFISRALSEGCNIRAVCEYVGTSPVTLLKYYASVPEAELAAVARRATAYLGPQQLHLLTDFSTGN
jgi:integrase